MVYEPKLSLSEKVKIFLLRPPHQYNIEEFKKLIDNHDNKENVVNYNNILYIIAYKYDKKSYFDEYLRKSMIDFIFEKKTKKIEMDIIQKDKIGIIKNQIADEIYIKNCILCIDEIIINKKYELECLINKLILNKKYELECLKNKLILNKKYELECLKNKLILLIYVLNNYTINDSFYLPSHKIILLKFFERIIEDEKYKKILSLFSSFLLNNVIYICDHDELDAQKLMENILDNINRYQLFSFDDYLIFQKILSVISPTEKFLNKLIEICLKHKNTLNQKSHWYFYLIVKQCLEHPNMNKKNILKYVQSSINTMYMLYSNSDETNLKYIRILNRLLLSTCGKECNNDSSITLSQKVQHFYEQDFSIIEYSIIFNSENIQREYESIINKIKNYQRHRIFNIYLPHDRNNYAIQIASKIGDHEFLTFLNKLKESNPYIDFTCDDTYIPAFNIIKNAVKKKNDDYRKCSKILIEDGSVPLNYSKYIYERQNQLDKYKKEMQKKMQKKMQKEMQTRKKFNQNIAQELQRRKQHLKKKDNQPDVPITGYYSLPSDEQSEDEKNQPESKIAQFLNKQNEPEREDDILQTKEEQEKIKQAFIDLNNSLKNLNIE